MKVSRRRFTGILGGVIAALGVGAKGTTTSKPTILAPPQTVSSGVVLKSAITGSTFLSMVSYSDACYPPGFRISAEALHDLAETSDFPKMYFVKESE